MVTESDYPRTLIVGAHFTEQSGSGTFLGRIFSSWPVDRLATVCHGDLPPDWLRCRRHYRTGDLEFRVMSPMNRLVPAQRSSPVQPPTAVTTPPCAEATSSSVSLWRRLVRYPWRAMLSSGANFYRVYPSAQLLAWVRDFHPDLLYGHCSDLNSVRFLHRMQQALGLPLVLHFMDDWAETLYREGWVSRFSRPRYLAEFAELVRSADVVIAICKEMAEEYEKRYQRTVLWLPMPVELNAYQTTSRAQWTAGRPFRLRYGGRVGWAIRESLADLARAVHFLRQEGADVVFDLVTFEREEVPAACLTSTGVTLKAPGLLVELPRLQAEADVLVVCYDFDQDSFRQARYSMPSKLADCLASCTPILVYGPPGLPVVEYARWAGFGKVVDRCDPEALRAAICELMDSSALREQLGRTAQRLATEQHDAKMVSESFRAILRDAVNEASVSVV